VKYRYETEEVDCGWITPTVMFGRDVAIYVSFGDGRIGNPSYQRVYATLGYGANQLPLIPARNVAFSRGNA